MEFRYRSIDTERAPPATDTAPCQSPKQNSSFLPARPIPGSSEDQIREAIQREIEKEQIRQEIIIAEASRKRELIAEVLQEMAIERRVSNTGMSLGEKLTMWINQMKLPNQNQNIINNNLFSQKLNVLDRDDTISPNPKADSVGAKQSPQLQQMPEATSPSVLESNKESLTVLARADPVGAKRKAEDTQTGLGEHLQGKKHKSKELALEAKTMSEDTGETVSSELPCLGKLGSGKQVESKLRSSYKFWCEICRVGTFSQTVMSKHELGKKHKAAVKQQNKAPEAASTSLFPASVTVPQSETITACENANPQGQKVDEMSANETTGKKTEGEKKKKVTFWCKTCNIQTNSERMLRNHDLGKKHKALLEKQQKKLLTVPVRSLNADPEEKESVSLAMDHTKGKVHCLEKA